MGVALVVMMRSSPGFWHMLQICLWRPGLSGLSCARIAVSSFRTMTLSEHELTLGMSLHKHDPMSRGEVLAVRVGAPGTRSCGPTPSLPWISIACAHCCQSLGSEICSSAAG